MPVGSWSRIDLLVKTELLAPARCKAFNYGLGATTVVWFATTVVWLESTLSAPLDETAVTT